MNKKGNGQMARKSKLMIAAESALQNLMAIHVLAQDNPAGKHATYLRNADDCARWCDALRHARVAYPPFMYAGGLNYFTNLWRLPKPLSAADIAARQADYPKAR